MSGADRPETINVPRGEKMSGVEVGSKKVEMFQVKSSVLEVRKKLRDKAASDPKLKHNFSRPGQGGK